MSFLDHFDADQRALFFSVSSQIALDKGAYLMRRGEPGGDLFLIEEGQLEIVDARATPESILAVLGPGGIVGEGSFIDDSPRSADARAPAEVRVRAWAKEDLRALLRREPSLAACFYRSLAATTTDRLRNQNQSTLASMAGRDGVLRAGMERVRNEVLTFTTEVKEQLLDAETLLRQDVDPRVGRAAVIRSMNRTERWVESHFASHPDLDDGEISGRLLSRELHPYLIRSALAERSIRRTQGVAGVTEVLAHVLVDSASGDGQLGEILDRWLLDRPTFRAMRATRDLITPLVERALPAHRNRRVAVLNAGTGSLVAKLGPALAEVPTVLSVVDQSRDALAFLDAGLNAQPSSVRLQTIQANLVEVALGRTRQQIPPQDCVIVHGLLEYLPDRLALGLLTQCRLRMTREGSLIVTALAPSRDRVLLDRLLGWPTVRRTRERMQRLIERAGLEPQSVAHEAEPLLLFTARPQ